MIKSVCKHIYIYTYKHIYIYIYTHTHIYIYYQAGASLSSVHLHFPTGVASNLSTGDCQRTSSGPTPGSVRVGEESYGEIWLSKLVSNPCVTRFVPCFFCHVLLHICLMITFTSIVLLNFWTNPLGVGPTGWNMLGCHK